MADLSKLSKMQSTWKVILLFSFFSRLSHSAIYHEMFEAVEEYSLPPLPYDYNELEPYIDERTVRVHYQKHHQGYTNKMNNALKEWRKEEPNNVLARTPIINILRNLNKVPEKWRTSLRNNGGGYVNHIYYWATMCPGPGEVPRALEVKIKETFPAGMTEFKESFTTASLSLFGSGYVWLVTDDEENLRIISTKDQDCPISSNQFPILVLDVWEHSYYLKHQNMRPHYVKDWWSLVCWQEVENLRNFWQAKPIKDEL